MTQLVADEETLAVEAKQWVALFKEGSASETQRKEFAASVIRSPMHMAQYIFAVADDDEACKLFGPPAICTLNELIDVTCRPMHLCDEAAFDRTP